MSLKLTMIFILGCSLIYKLITNKIRNKQRTKPVPEEVADVYEPERYQSFLNYKADCQSFGIKTGIIKLIVESIIILSPLFSALNFTNAYITYLVTILVLEAIDDVMGFYFQHYSTFEIQQKYHLNKKTEAEFRKDFLIECITNYISMAILGVLLIFVIELCGKYIAHHTISYLTSTIIVVLIGAVFFAALLIISLIQLFSLTKQYTITDLEEGELKDKILEMLKGVKKKIRRIIVYNESKKSVNKNAFVLKLLNYRVIGIADNFLKENAQKQLYGVIAHEVGHLKHKKNIYNYLKYLFLILLAAGIIYLLPNISHYYYLIERINDVFHVENNYYVYMYVATTLLTPLFAVGGVYSNYVTRLEEYEADQNAVKEGYAEDLITLFKELSKDELIDVNPAPIIEFLEYDHPGMYHRILGLRNQR